VTPEGVALDFRVAPVGDRVAAFLLDLFYQAMALLLLGLAMSVLLMGAGGFFGGVAAAAGALFLFFVQNLYFIVFEARTRGQTPGKRQLGIRVMDANGGPLTTEAVIVRNVMRSLEFWFPLLILLAPERVLPGIPGWATLLAILWVVILGALPLFNQWNLRAGDLVAGTLVVVAPRSILLDDIGKYAVEKRADPEDAYVFNQAQLDAYGIYELQVLEEVLRRESASLDQQRTARAVADRIARKIRWPVPIPHAETRRFLREYYAALRLRLEQRMLFGKRKEDKHDR
jgi:uncharacterized RDD family membrane protein YckC